MSYIIDMRDDPFARSIDLVNPIKRIAFDGDGEYVQNIAPPSKDSPALTAALEAMAEAGRKSNGFGDRRLPWLRALDDYLESQA
jgi:hypothetical protein